MSEDSPIRPDCCETDSDPATKASAKCPACDQKGKAVKPITVEALVDKDVRSRVGRSDGFRYCSEQSCEVVYYHPETGARILSSEVLVRIGQKVTKAPHPICYCFDHTVEEIEAEVLATGKSQITDNITEKCHQGLDRCEETNPQGSCCLGNVRKTMKDARKVSALRRPHNTGMWATIGAVTSAIFSSVCCWLPLLLIVFGTSAAGVAGFLGAYRSVFLGASALFLTGGFYFVYFRKEKCAPGQACAMPSRKIPRRLNKVMLWGSTVVVLAFTLFPNYVGILLGSEDPVTVTASSTLGESLVFSIEGMTCEACSVALQGYLGDVPGVALAEVSFEAKTARIFFAQDQEEPSISALLDTIRRAGYVGTLVDNNP